MSHVTWGQKTSPSYESLKVLDIIFELNLNASQDILAMCTMLLFRGAKTFASRVSDL